LNCYSASALKQQFAKYHLYHCIGDVMVSMIAPNAVDRGFEHWLGQTNNYKIDIVASLLSTQH